MQEQLTGHLHLFLVFLIPLLPYLVVLHLSGRIGRAGFVAFFSSCLISQFLLFPEILATATIFGGVAMIAAARFFPELPAARFRRAAVFGGCHVRRRPSFCCRLIWPDSWAVNMTGCQLQPGALLNRPNFAATTTGIWLGQWDGGAVAIGVVGTPQGLRSVISTYADKAEKVYFPYPVVYSGHINDALVLQAESSDTGHSKGVRRDVA